MTRTDTALPDGAFRHGVRVPRRGNVRDPFRNPPIPIDRRNLPRVTGNGNPPRLQTDDQRSFS